MGDSYLVLFEAPTEAILCGTAIQDRLWEYARRVPESQRIEVRVAVALGEVRLVRTAGVDDVFGEAVNLASRIEGEAESGEVWLSESVWWVMDRSRVELEDLGSRSLKGFPEAVRLFRVARRDRPDDPPYANQGLALVNGLAPPDPEELARRIAAGPVRETRPRWPLAALLVLLGLATALLVWQHVRPSFDELVQDGKLEEAELLLGALAVDRGLEDADVRAAERKLEAARVPTGGHELVASFEAWSRALADGSPTALEWLTRQAHSPACERRRLAAKALAASGSPEAQGPLEALAADEPEVPHDALARLGRALWPAGRCGDGDLARAALKRLRKQG
ncbi:MAG: adenylate/guanylate cyclase domain-containing protein [Anaeromyxobacteraceae bacterium]